MRESGTQWSSHHGFLLSRRSAQPSQLEKRPFQFHAHRKTSLCAIPQPALPKPTMHHSNKPHQSKLTPLQTLWLSRKPPLSCVNPAWHPTLAHRWDDRTTDFNLHVSHPQCQSQSVPPHPESPLATRPNASHPAPSDSTKTHSRILMK